MNLKDNFKNQLSENINCHINLINIHKDIEAVIKLIFNSLKKGGKFYFVEMVDPLPMHNIWLLNF